VRSGIGQPATSCRTVTKASCAFPACPSDGSAHSSSWWQSQLQSWQQRTCTPASQGVAELAGSVITGRSPRHRRRASGRPILRYCSHCALAKRRSVTGSRHSTFRSVPNRPLTARRTLVGPPRQVLVEHKGQASPGDDTAAPPLGGETADGLRAACRNRTGDLLITSASGTSPGTAGSHRARPFSQLRRNTERHLAPTVTRYRRIRRDHLAPSSDPRLSPSEASSNLLPGAQRRRATGPGAERSGR